MMRKRSFRGTTPAKGRVVLEHRVPRPIICQNFTYEYRWLREDKVDDFADIHSRVEHTTEMATRGISRV